MPSRFKQYVSHTLRPLLIRLLRWTERSGPLPGPRSSVFFHREVHVPTWVVGAGVWGMLTAVLFLELGPGWGALISVAILTTGLVGLFRLFIHHDHPELVHDDDAIALVGVLVVAAVLGMNLWFHTGGLVPYGMPLSAVSILVTVLLHPRVGVVLTLVLALLFGILNSFSLEGALVVCFGGMAGVARSLHVRTRRDVTMAGLWVAAGGGAAVVMLALMERWPLEQCLSALKWVGGGAVFSVLLVLALLPLLEICFSRLSNIRLLELSDVNHPLLKEMSLEAPGTYHHSLITASLAQAAAERIGANALLCRVGAYFHDIGKLVKPEYFVENQGAIGNPHELLPPNMSRIVIQSHVKDGLALAQRHNLDRLITEFILMHHGTCRVEYFYRRAIEQTGAEESVDEDLYRYPGPKPHSKETAIVMLADSVEASARTLENPSHQRLVDHVSRIVDSKILDGQFEEVPLTLAEVSQVKDAFVNTLVGIYHTRLHYPTSQETDVEHRPPRPS
ncbi:MAG: HDIG domain-containing protein [Elusimicrobia bacterium]|nr:HDIG domain-containing protein [Elusimicrobiota bacterium]